MDQLIPYDDVVVFTDAIQKPIESTWNRLDQLVNVFYCVVIIIIIICLTNSYLKIFKFIIVYPNKLIGKIL